MRLIKISQDHYVVVDDSEIKDGDWMIRDGEQPTLVTPNFWWDFGVPYKKITHSTQPNKRMENVTFISPRKVKELIGEVDVEKKAEKFIGCEYEDIEDNIDQIGYDSFIRGYNQALEDNKEKKYTEEDIRKAWEAGMAFIGEDKGSYRELIQSVQPKTEWEVELIDGQLKLKQ